MIVQAADNKSDDSSSFGSPDTPSITDSDPSPFGSPCTQAPPSKTDLDSDPRPDDDIVQDCSSAGTKCIQSEELTQQDSCTSTKLHRIRPDTKYGNLTEPQQNMHTRNRQLHSTEESLR